MPLPIIELTTSATRLQRPMARTSSWRGLGCGESGEVMLPVMRVCYNKTGS